MVVNTKGTMLTARAIPNMVLIQPQWNDDELTLSYPDKESITINVKEVVYKNVIKDLK